MQRSHGESAYPLLNCLREESDFGGSFRARKPFEQAVGVSQKNAAQVLRQSVVMGDLGRRSVDDKNNPGQSGLVVVPLDLNLSSNLTRGKHRCVDVRVTLSIADDPQGGSEVSGRDALGCWADNVSGADGTYNCPGGRFRAARLATPAAQENHDPTTHIRLGKVDVRRGRVG